MEFKKIERKDRGPKTLEGIRFSISSNNFGAKRLNVSLGYKIFEKMGRPEKASILFNQKENAVFFKIEKDNNGFSVSPTLKNKKKSTHHFSCLLPDELDNIDLHKKNAEIEKLSTDGIICNVKI